MTEAQKAAAWKLWNGGEKNKAEIARQVKSNRVAVSRLIRGADRSEEYKSRAKTKNKARTNKKGATGGLSEKELFAQYDRDTQARIDIDREIEEGFDGRYWPEAEWRARCGHSSGSPGYASVSRESAYDQYKFMIGDAVFWTSPEQVVAICEKMLRARPYVHTGGRR